MSFSLLKLHACRAVKAVRRLTCKHLKAFVTVCVLFLVTLHIPKSRWLCCSDPNDAPYKYNHGNQIDIPFDELYRKLNVREPIGRPEKLTGKQDFPGQHTNVLRMFPIYSESRTNTRSASTSKPRRFQARVKRFILNNYDFKNFNRFWVNKKSGSGRRGIASNQEINLSRKLHDPGSILELLEADHAMPECITLRFRRPLQPPTKVCVHSRREDNVISNQLRDFGHWEPDLMDQMQTFFEVSHNFLNYQR
ncbi:hypothetical protein ElyMa_002486500 [Elysia marginata]|uniref:Uncharacterized protein n=1 Tax=Elysia marginata TaxID=1093978 RepID=A0AAV4GP37_9GAST|nr:hypothetical protein ElyMa_002486500 [Elysia marginata]